jgi:putative membrane protein
VIPRFSDHAANERTYLAWVRTAITVMAFGFLLERFDILLFYASHVTGHTTPGLHLHGSEWLGLLLLLFGAFVVLLATYRFNRNRKLIDSDINCSYGGALLERVMTGMLILMAVFLVIYVARQVLALG